jgi:hypothetical protein
LASAAFGFGCGAQACSGRGDATAGGGIVTTIIDAMQDAEIGFGRWFGGDSWANWRTILKAAFALPMTANERVVFRDLAGGREPPTNRVRELWIAAGRRAGKDSIASMLATYAATIEEAHVGRLRPGELATVQCLACDREQAQIVLGYIKAFFEAIPDLAHLIVRETRLGLELASGVNITVATNSFRQTRGRTISLAIFDECSFWRSEETVNPDRETYRAVLPGLATLPGSMLIAISSPYRKAGLLFDKWKQHFGKDSADVLVIQATSRQLNPTLDQGLVDAAIEDDPQAARSEWLGEWRNDLASFIDVEMIEACTDRGVTVRPPRAGVRYVAFVDAASGTGQDAFAVGIAHRDRDEIVLDLAHECRPPFSPSQAISEVCGLLKGYGIASVIGDKYAPGFVSEAFAQHRVTYAYSERDRSQIYVEALPLLTSGRARLVDNKKLALQFAGLERRTNSGGKDRIDHGQNGHDDLANSAAGALVEVATAPQAMHISDEVMRQASMLRRPGWSAHF